ncbi:CopD family protein [Ruixingdingia sedimenti]|uniref:Protoporphyrinogen IX oxidase n=1 Tax=Ruixingdingia sedimenti TaxID=3073604 RepID=A0ABU1F3K2_9RHOB|nr:CopD family protein [Xinfangfangia sp. LG-4]MDR5651454.1 CopD family protein [Xinfangfangia sp. LG-4]
MIAGLKALHIAGLVCWCAALIGLPLLLHRHGGRRTQRGFAEYRLVTHIGYIAFATPAALVTIAAGTALVLLAGVFEPWLLVKLAAVAGMVLVHVWLGHMIQRSGEERRSDWHGGPLAGLALAVPLMALVLGLVLVKPDAGLLARLVPDQFFAPRAVSP